MCPLALITFIIIIIITFKHANFIKAPYGESIMEAHQSRLN